MIVDRPSDLDAAAIRSVAGGRARLRLSAGLLDRLAANRAAALSALDEQAPVYGVHTGMGAMSGRRLDPAQEQAHQRNLLVGRAVGGPPWLSRVDTRAVLATRLRTLLNADAAVSPGLCTAIADLLDRDRLPLVPAAGAGTAGEIVSLAHAFGPLVGVGSLVAADGRPVCTDPVSLGPKEGIALLAGVPGATALAAVRAGEVRALADRLLAVAGGSICAVRARRDPYSVGCGRADPCLDAVLARLRAVVGDEPEPRSLQAPVSFRVVGHVLAGLLRAVDALDAAVDRALAGVTDSPAFLDGRFVGTAGFHGLDLAAACDGVRAALAHAAEVSAARLHRLLDPAVTGLTAQLARDPGPQAGLVTVHKRAVGHVHLLRRLAGPTPIGLVETSGGQEDVQSFAWEAAGLLREAVDLTRAVAAGELLAVVQAHALSGRAVPPALAAAAEIVPPIDQDRALGPDIEALDALLNADPNALATAAT